MNYKSTFIALLSFIALFISNSLCLAKDFDADNIKVDNVFSSNDLSIKISGPSFTTQDKYILKNFVEDIRIRLSKVLGEDFPASTYRIWLYGEENIGNNSYAKYSIKLFPNLLKNREFSTIRINITNPAQMDPRDLAFYIVKSYLGLKMCYLSNSREINQNAIPDWFIKGLSCAIDFNSRYRYINECMTLWEQAKLPFSWEIVGKNSLYASYDGISTSMVLFWLDAPNKSERLNELLRNIAKSDWDKRIFYKTRTNSENPLIFDERFDYWLIQNKFDIHTIGKITNETILRIIHHLNLYVGLDGVPIILGEKYQLLVGDTIADYASSTWAKRVAVKKLDFISRVSAGRDEDFRLATEKIKEFYIKIISNKFTKKDKYLYLEGVNNMLNYTLRTKSIKEGIR